VLQCVAVCCGEFQCVAVYCNVCCSVLQCVGLIHVHRKRIVHTSHLLQCVAVCCGVLQCVTVCCSVFQCVSVRCSVLQCVLQSVLQCVGLIHVHRKRVVHTSHLLQCVAVCCGVLRCVAVCFSALQCVAVCVAVCCNVCCSVLRRAWIKKALDKVLFMCPSSALCICTFVFMLYA